MKPKFLRLPGGNYLEGDLIADRYDFKKTIGPLVDRAGHQAPWTYWSTDGLGLLEFLEWTEDPKIEPVLAVYAGLRPLVAEAPASSHAAACRCRRSIARSSKRPRIASIQTISRCSRC